MSKFFFITLLKYLKKTYNFNLLKSMFFTSKKCQYITCELTLFSSVKFTFSLKYIFLSFKIESQQLHILSVRQLPANSQRVLKLDIFSWIWETNKDSGYKTITRYA